MSEKMRTRNTLVLLLVALLSEGEQQGWRRDNMHRYPLAILPLPSLKDSLPSSMITAEGSRRWCLVEGGRDRPATRPVGFEAER